MSLWSASGFLRRVTYTGLPGRSGPTERCGAAVADSALQPDHLVATVASTSPEVVSEACAVSRAR